MPVIRRVRGVSLAVFALIATAALPLRLLAHDGQPVAPHDVGRAWTFEPFVVLALALSAILYVRGWRAMRRASSRDRGASVGDTTCFTAGWLVLAIALVSPLHAMGGSLFSAHMGQHELLMVVAAPLLVLGRPMVPMLWALPMEWRRKLGAFAGNGVVRRPWRFLTGATVAFVAHAMAIWGWHLPAPYQLSIASELAHSAQHASFFFTALLFWWSLVHGREGRMGYGAAVLYVFGTALHTTILGALLTFADAPWYPIYGRSTMLWGLSALEDQQLAGLIMWIPAAIAYVVTALWLLSRWIRESERRVKLREGTTSPASVRTSAMVTRVTTAAVVASLLLSGCDMANRDDEARILAGGDPAVGKALIKQFGCGSCHTIPGVRGSQAIVGPPLKGIASRAYIAGVLPNTPENMQRWIVDPPGVDSLTAMPNLGLTPAQARHVSAYLYTLH